jgi:hypothetical protein
MLEHLHDELPKDRRGGLAMRLRKGAACVISVVMMSIVGWAGPANAGDIAEWVIACPFSHRASDDPIVFPGQPGAAHSHDFFGNETTDAFSTLRSLETGPTTCGFRPDRAAYWVPTLYSAGKATAPDLVKVYYTSRHARPATIKPFPGGLKVVAGNAHATGPQSTSIVHWDCGEGGPKENRDHPVDCGSASIQASLLFPDCWDGSRRDSPNHMEHMAYSTDHDDDGGYRCPRSHPVPVPRIKVVIQWPVHDGTTVTLSSGPAYTLHGDFFDAWRRRALKRLIERCLVAQVSCGKVGI